MVLIDMLMDIDDEGEDVIVFVFTGNNTLTFQCPIDVPAEQAMLLFQSFATAALQMVQPQTTIH